MPYIITISTLRDRYSIPNSASQRAVATLDETRNIALKALPRAASLAQVNSARSLPEQGGTVGPLPDGTVIEVERVSGYALMQRIPDATMRPKRRAYGEHFMADTIAAYNRSQDA